MRRRVFRRLGATRTRLLSGFLATALVAVALSVALKITIETARIRDDAAAALAADWSTTVHTLVTLPGSRRTFERVRDVVHLLDGRDMVDAVLIEKDGRIRERSAPPRRGRPAPDWFVRAVIGEDTSRRFEIADVGSLVLTARPVRAADRLWWDSLVLAALVAAAVAAAGAVAMAAVGRFVRALRKLDAAFGRVSTGDLDGHLALDPGPQELDRLRIGHDRMVDALRTARARDARIAAQRSAAEDEERRALARDLHDEIGPLLFAVDVDAGAIRALAEAPDGPVRAADIAARASAIEAAVAAMKREVRALLGQLRPGTAMKIGLEQALGDVVGFFAERHPAVRFTVSAPVEGWGGTVDGAVTAIVREAIANALRHARPTRIDVAVELRDGMIRLKVADDGGGLGAPKDGIGYGIVGMRERAAALGGRLAVENRLDIAGVVVSAAIRPPG